MARSVKNAKLIFGGLVNFDVQLFSAARDEASGFNQVHAHADGSVCKTSQQNFCSGCSTVIPFPQLQKGVEVNKGQYAVVDAEALKGCSAPDCSDITIEKFVPLAEVDPVFFDASYFLAPQFTKKSDGRVPYELLYQSMKSKGLAGVATVTIRGKMHNVFIRVYANGLMLHTIFCSKEIRAVAEFDAKRDVVINEKQLAICAMLIDSLVASFDSKAVVNQYDEKVDALVAGVVAGTTASDATATGDNVMAQMMASIEKLTGKPVAAVVSIDTKEKVA